MCCTDLRLISLEGNYTELIYLLIATLVHDFAQQTTAHFGLLNIFCYEGQGKWIINDAEFVKLQIWFYRLKIEYHDLVLIVDIFLTIAL